MPRPVVIAQERVAFRDPQDCTDQADDLALLEAVRRRFDMRCLLLTVGPVVYFTVVHSVFVGSLRYRLPAEYPLLILSAAGLIAARDKFRNRSAISPVSST